MTDPSLVGPSALHNPLKAYHCNLANHLASSIRNPLTLAGSKRHSINHSHVDLPVFHRFRDSIRNLDILWGSSRVAVFAWIEISDRPTTSDLGADLPWELGMKHRT